MCSILLQIQESARKPVRTWTWHTSVAVRSLVGSASKQGVGDDDCGVGVVVCMYVFLHCDGGKLN